MLNKLPDEIRSKINFYSLSIFIYYINNTLKYTRGIFGFNHRPNSFKIHADGFNY